MSDLSQLTQQIEKLKEENQNLRGLIHDYNEIMKINEAEMINNEAIIEMYEQLVEHERLEMKQATETAQAFENTVILSGSEQAKLYEKIRELEKQNEELKRKHKIHE